MRVVLLLLFSLSLPLTGDEIAYAIEGTKTPKDIKSILAMKIVDSKGREKNKKIKTITRDRSRMQILWFLEPAKDKGISLLKIDYADKPDEMRMWIPAIKKTRRITSSKRTGSFMGSDLSYEDLYNKDLSEFIYHYKYDEVYNDTDCYVVEIVPREGIVTDYGRHVAWISKKGFQTIKEESYNKSGIKYKQKDFTYIISKDYKVIESIYVKNFVKGSSTSLKFNDIQVDTGVSNNLFHEKNLKRIAQW